MADMNTTGFDAHVVNRIFWAYLLSTGPLRAYPVRRLRPYSCDRISSSSCIGRPYYLFLPGKEIVTLPLEYPQVCARILDDYFQRVCLANEVIATRQYVYPFRSLRYSSVSAKRASSLFYRLISTDTGCTALHDDPFRILRLLMKLQGFCRRKPGGLQCVGLVAKNEVFFRTTEDLLAHNFVVGRAWYDDENIFIEYPTKLEPGFWDRPVVVDTTRYYGWEDDGSEEHTLLRHMVEVKQQVLRRLGMVIDNGISLYDLTCTAATSSMLRLYKSHTVDTFVAATFEGDIFDRVFHILSQCDLHLLPVALTSHSVPAVRAGGSWIALTGPSGHRRDAYIGPEGYLRIASPGIDYYAETAGDLWRSALWSDALNTLKPLVPCLPKLGPRIEYYSVYAKPYETTMAGVLL